MLRMKRATAIGFAQALSGAATVDEVDSVIRTGLAPLVAAPGAILGTVDHDAHVLRLQLTGVLDPEIARRHQPLALAQARPFSERSGAQPAGKPRATTERPSAATA